MNRTANFDRISRPYRRLEYLTLGRALERCRLHFLPRLAGHFRALVLGDGDGRFLACLLEANTCLTADAVDTSGAMLTLLRNRCAFASSRLRTHQVDALAFTQISQTDLPQYDLIVTHFFLDCLSQSQVDALAAATIPHLAPNAVWLVSDFRIPPGPMHFPARVFVRSLYLAFRLLTGLGTTQLPDHASALARAGFNCIAKHHSLFGMVTTELWSASTPSVPSFRMTGP